MLLILHIIQFLTILCHSVLSILVYLPLQDFCVFPSYYMLKGAILFSNLVMRQFLFLKVKLTYFATEIQLSYPEWIATCIQLKSLEKYLLWANISLNSDEFIFRNLTKCKDHFELRKGNVPLSYTRMRELFIDVFRPFASDIRNMDYTV